MTACRLALGFCLNVWGFLIEDKQQEGRGPMHVMGHEGNMHQARGPHGGQNGLMIVSEFMILPVSLMRMLGSSCPHWNWAKSLRLETKECILQKRFFRM